MLDTIIRKQPHGPYYIAGYWYGGLLAYEIAGRLRAAGQPVAWLGLLDAAAPAAEARWLRSHFSLRQRAVRQRQRGPRATLAKIGEVVRREAPSYKDLLKRRVSSRTGPRICRASTTWVRSSLAHATPARGTTPQWTSSPQSPGSLVRAAVLSAGRRSTGGRSALTMSPSITPRWSPAVTSMPLRASTRSTRGRQRS